MAKGEFTMSRTSWILRIGTALCALVLVTAATAALAATTGKIAGTVREKDKAALPGVTVIVDGTRLGAIADDQGRFTILNVPAGTYTLRGRLIGYADYVINNLEVRPDFTTEANLEMSPDAIQQEPVIVESTRPLIQKDATGTTRFLSGEDIQNLPTRGYRDAASLQSGVVNFSRSYDPRGVERESQNTPQLIVRGGRANEVAYIVDGFSQADPLTGTSSTNISNNAIDEVAVLTGGFSAEYGKVSSGIINVVTREGTPNYYGSVEAVTDALAGDWVGAERYDWNVYDGSFGGPVIKGNDFAHFYVSGQRRWQADRQTRFVPEPLQEAQASFLGTPEGRLQNNSLDGWTWQGKLSLRPSDRLNVKIGTSGSHDDWQEFLQTYLYNSAHMPRYQDRNKSVTGQLNYTFNPTMFATFATSWFQTERKRGDGVFFDDVRAYSQPGGNPSFDPDLPYFWPEGHVFDDYLRRKSEYIGFKGDVTSQVDRYHQLKLGANAEFHTLKYYNAYFPAGIDYDSTGAPIPGGALNDIDRYGFDEFGNETEFADDDLDGPKHPKTMGLFLQDKYEREGLIVNGGLRLDYIDTATEALASEEEPLGVDDVLNEPDLVDNKTYLRLSPRLGVAFPVTDRTKLRINYGQFFQQVNLQDLYVSYRYLEHKIRTGGYFVGFGNPNLRPERTTAYETGVEHQIGERMRIDATAYYKDVKDLVEIINIPSRPNAFSSYRNRDFATIKGVDVGFSMRPVNNISASINYSLSYAQGTGSVSNSQRNVAWTASQPPKMTAPLDFDQRHKLSINADYRFGSGQGPKVGGSSWFENSGINVLVNIGSGTPYTPVEVYDEVTLAAVSTTPLGSLNSRYGPWTSTVDLKMNKGFGLGGVGFDAYVWVLNLFDTNNQFGVYESSGSAYTTNYLNTPAGKAFLADQGQVGAETYELAQSNPDLFGNPRLVRFGLRANF
jgi:outer membrane receptor protein involved in Fe transport